MKIDAYLAGGCNGACVVVVNGDRTGSPIAGNGSVFFAAGSQWDVDPRLIVAIAGAESSFGTNWQACPASGFNAWSWFWAGDENCPGSPYSSFADGIQNVTHFMNKWMFKRFTTVASIGSRYCTSGCANWVPNVTRFYEDLGGDQVFGNDGSITNLTFTLPATPPTWSHFALSGGGPALNSTPVVYDPASNQIMVFGSLVTGPCCTSLNDMWVLTNANGLGGTPEWKQLTVTGSGNPELPAGREGQSAVYDQANNRMIIFGGGQFAGAGFNPIYQDVWVLSNANGVGTPTWTQLFPLTPNGAPAPRAAHRAVNDANTNRMIIFGGGNNGSNDQNDTWVLTNANGLGGPSQWIPLSPTGGLPAPREIIAAVSYDPAANAMTVFGGVSGNTFLGDLWILSNANGLGGAPAWQQVSQTAPAPGTLANWNYGYDPTTKSLLFFGGSPGFGAFRNDFWVLSNANGVGAPTWINTIPNNAPGSPPASVPLGTYDPIRNRFMIVPDAADLWVLTDGNGGQ